MNISDVIQKADVLYPNKFSDSEKISWLDELGAMLQTEYKKQYAEYKLQYGDEGIILPEGVMMSDIRRIFVRGIEIPKLSLLCKPGRNVKHRYTIPIARYKDDIRIVYQVKYTPIQDAATTQTLCPAPYDSMYTDWLLAKICFYNRDTDGYNQYMTSYNQWLVAYRNQLKNEAEVDRSCQFVGWI